MIKRVLLFVSVLVSSNACAPKYGAAFPNTAATARDIYLYGAHSTGPGKSPEPEGQRVAAVDAAADNSESDEATTSSKGSEEVTPTTEAGEDSAERAPEHETSIAVGTYRGTDWVTIDLPGFPGNEQVDDKARVVVAAVDGTSRLSFTVLDTNSGNELCSVEAEVIDDLMAFEPDQECFSGILGIPMATSVYEGEGRTAKGMLEVTLGVELKLTSPDGDEIVGDLSYRFEGKLTAASGASR